MKKGLFKYFKVVWKEGILAIFFILFETVLETLVPFMASRVVDVGIANNDLPYIYKWGALMVCSAFLAFFIGIISVRYVARTGQGFGAELRRAQFAKLQSLDQEARDKFAVSSLITRLTNDTYTIQNAIIIGMRGIFRAPFMITMVLMLSFNMNSKVAIVFALTLPVIAFAMLVIVFRVRPLYERMQRNFDELNRTLQENFQAIRVVKAYVTEEQEEAKFKAINKMYRKVASNAFMTVSLNSPIMQLGLYSTIIGLLLVGGNLINTGEAKIGEIQGLLTFVLQLLNAMLMLAQILIMFGRTSASKSRISQVLNTDTSLEYLINDLSVKAKPSLIVKDVSFKYPGTSDDNYALKNINFTLKAGETLGIIGQTGSGKSTLVHLLARLYDVTDGEIILDDHNVKDYSADNLLDAINIVFQNNMLFSGTIRDNLLWGNKDASDEEINRALEASLSDEIVNKLANGLNSEVGQAGSLLSGGQKQRIALARALLKRPKILVLDDSLSAIDTINEGKIRTKLRKLYPELTLIIVAQRVSAIKDADHILVLHEGEIHGAGTHNSLVENDEIYHDIYTTQLKGAKA